MQVELSTILKVGRVFLMCNKDIREYARQKNVYLWQIALRLHINDGNLSRKLRTELSNEKKVEIFKIIDELSTSGR